MPFTIFPCILPAVANIDQALVVFAVVKPEPNFNLLDRFLIMMEQQGLDSVSMIYVFSCSAINSECLVVCFPLSILRLISPVCIPADGFRQLIKGFLS